MNITIVLGTARTDNQTKHVSRVVYEAFSSRDNVDAEHVDVKDYVTKVASMPVWGTDGLDEGLSKWKEIAEKSEGFVFVLPEYNHGYPGEWKLLVDALTESFHGKPAAIVGVSAGIFSGARMIEQVKPVLIELGLVAVSTALYVGKVKDKFDAKGAFIDEGEKERLEKFVDTFMEDVKKAQCS